MERMKNEKGLDNKEKEKQRQREAERERDRERDRQSQRDRLKKSVKDMQFVLIAS